MASETVDLTIAEVRSGLDDLKSEFANALRPWRQDAVAVRTAMMSDDLPGAVLFVYLDGNVHRHIPSLEFEGEDYKAAFVNARAWLASEIALDAALALAGAGA